MFTTMPNAITGAMDTTLNQTDNLDPHGAYSLMGGDKNYKMGWQASCNFKYDGWRRPDRKGNIWLKT